MSSKPNAPVTSDKQAPAKGSKGDEGKQKDNGKGKGTPAAKEAPAADNKQKKKQGQAGPQRKKR